MSCSIVFFFQAEDGIRDVAVTGVQTCALPISQHQDPPRLDLDVPSDDGLSTGDPTLRGFTRNRDCELVPISTGVAIVLDQYREGAHARVAVTHPLRAGAADRRGITDDQQREHACAVDIDEPRMVEVLQLTNRGAIQRHALYDEAEVREVFAIRTLWHSDFATARHLARQALNRGARGRRVVRCAWIDRRRADRGTVGYRAAERRRHRDGDRGSATRDHTPAGAGDHSARLNAGPAGS